MNQNQTPTLGDGFQTATSDLYQRLHSDIISGKIEPGKRLVRRTLAAEFGLSHIPVTEALIRLEQDGLVESAPMHGARVRRISDKAIREEQVLREAIECHCARLCAEKAHKADLEVLRALAEEVDERMCQKAKNPDAGNQKHMEFHLELAKRTGIDLLAEELRRIGFIELMRLNWTNATVYHDMPPRWHQSLVEALASGKPAHAETAMRKHVRFGAERLLDAFKKTDKGS